MRSTILTILVLVRIALSAGAQEPVARLIDIQARGAKPLVQQRKANDQQWYPAFVGTQATVSDHFKTDAQTVAALEFFIGGRVAIAKNTDIEIVTERSVSSIEPSIKRVILHNGSLWMKSGGRLAHPLEIQTNGGTMGIKGTEFTLESEPESTKLVVLEGAVQVQNEKYLGVAKAGDVYDIQSTNQEPQRQHLTMDEVDKIKRDLLKNSGMENVGVSLDLLGLKVETQEAKDDLKRLQGPLAELLEKANAKGAKEEEGKDGYYLAAPFRSAIRAGVGPSGGSQLSTSNPAPQDTVFSWREHPGADGYVIFVSDSSDFKNILYSDRLRDSRAVYPSSARPLAAGRYFWRVVPVEANDNVVPGALAQQAAFEVSARP